MRGIVYYSPSPQLCRSMRGTFLPWRWKYVQFMFVEFSGLLEREQCQLAKGIFQRQFKTLVTMPWSAVDVKYVPTVSHGLSHLSSNPSSVHTFRENVPELTKLLPFLTYLEAFEVGTRDYKELNIKHSFESAKLPQTRTRVIDAYAHYLIKRCTRAKRIIIH